MLGREKEDMNDVRTGNRRLEWCQDGQQNVGMMLGRTVKDRNDVRTGNLIQR